MSHNTARSAHIALVGFQGVTNLPTSLPQLKLILHIRIRWATEVLYGQTTGKLLFFRDEVEEQDKQAYAPCWPSIVALHDGKQSFSGRPVKNL